MKYLDETGREIQNGDIFDIGQTVNGTSKFVILKKNDDVEIRYLSHDGSLGPKYEYDQPTIMKAIENVDDMEDITFVGNFFETDEITFTCEMGYPDCEREGGCIGEC